MAKNTRDLKKLVADVQKLFGKDIKAKEMISTGDTIKANFTAADCTPIAVGHPLQVLLSLPGIPFNKIIQVAGKPDCGKSTWASEALVQAQKAGVQGVLWDAEEKFDASRFTKMGGDPEALLRIKTNEILKGAEMVRRIIVALKDQDPTVKILVVWDSVGASQSRSHAERELDNEKHAQPGQDAKENAQVMKMLVALINKFPDSIATYLVNQTYAKIGFMQKGDAASGGTKIEYHSSMIIFLKRIKTLTKIVNKVETKIGIVTRATVTKNHLSQSDTSVHKLDFKITAAGSEVTELAEEDGEHAKDE